jgi:isoleucyl-tRNA synthetase
MIGKSLEADLHFLVRGEVFDLLKRHESGLKELLNVSMVLVLNASLEPGYRSQSKEGQIFKTMTTSDDLSFAVYSASGHKCARCWNFMPEVSDYGFWHNVCSRCQSALTEMGIQPPQPQSTEAAS